MTSQGGVKTTTATELRLGLRAFLDKVARTGERIVITKRDRPIAVLVPYQAQLEKAKSHRTDKRSAFGVLKGQIEITGDIVSPVYAEWAQDIDAELKRRRGRGD